MWLSVAAYSAPETVNTGETLALAVAGRSASADTTTTTASALQRIERVPTCPPLARVATSHMRLDALIMGTLVAERRCIRETVRAPLTGTTNAKSCGPEGSQDLT